VELTETRNARAAKAGSKKNRNEVFHDLARREQADKDARDQEAATKTQIIRDINQTASLPPISRMATSTPGYTPSRSNSEL
jgi:hypothetical protein